MELEKGDYILGYWIASDKDNNNWYMMVLKRNNKWHTEYTFRYHKDEDTWSGKDEKNVYKWEIDGNKSDEEILLNINVLFNNIKERFNDFNDFFLVKGGIKKFLKMAKTKHYLHLKVEKT